MPISSRNQHPPRTRRALLPFLTATAWLLWMAHGSAYAQYPPGPGAISPAARVAAQRGLPEPVLGNVAPEVVPAEGPVDNLDDFYSDENEITWQLLPKGLVYRAYLAGEKESRFRSVIAYERDRGWVWDITLGGRVGLLRYGPQGPGRPEGFQVDIEGAGIPRLDPEERRDLDSADFRFGVPFTYGTKFYQTKFGYYHLSSHLGDEFLIKHPSQTRYNYSRDVLVWGHSLYPTPELRIYGEVGWAFVSDVSEPWELQFGIDYSPARCTGFGGAPFAAVNAHLRDEVDFGGNFVAQAGWAWRSSQSSGLLRTGFEYYTGFNDQFSFFREYESKVGMGVWYDY